MADNRKEWDAWLEAEDARSVRRSVQELHSEGYEYLKQADFRRAASLFRQAAETAAEQGDVDGQCENLYREGSCWSYLGSLDMALERLLKADNLGGGNMAVRFYIVRTLLGIARRYPLPLADQEALLKKLAPYKGSQQIGGSKSMVLFEESLFLEKQGRIREALDRAQEALVCQVDEAPYFVDQVYYERLIELYRRNGRTGEAWKTLRDWREHGSTHHADTKSRQISREAVLHYDEGDNAASWDAWQRVWAEKEYLGISGNNPYTLMWLVFIGAKTGRFRELRPYLLRLFRFRHAEDADFRFICFRYFAYYYCYLAEAVRKAPEGNPSDGGTPWPCTVETARRRAARWLKRAEAVAAELDTLLETDVKRKQLDELREKLAEAGIQGEKP